jgi:hypothetical protein
MAASLVGYPWRLHLVTAAVVDFVVWHFGHPSVGVSFELLGASYPQTDLLVCISIEIMEDRRGSF